MPTAAELADRLDAEAARVAGELAEIDMLITQARTEAGRHDTRRTAAVEKLTAAAAAAGAGGAPGGAPGAGGADLAELATQVVTLTRRAAIMEAQADILESKRKSVARLHEWVVEQAGLVRALAGEDAGAGTGAGGAEAEAPSKAAAGKGGRKAANGPLSSVVMSAQEDLRREIARAMHDGPAQSLTNIVLQAQIVQRLLRKDPAAAEPEVRALIAMTQQTLEATKSFIFDVRPMVLDDLGLVPTLRRAARERGRRTGVPVEFETIGVERRLSVDVESALFRLLDGALVAYLAASPEAVSLKLDWSDVLAIDLSASRRMADVAKPDLPAAGADLPPALAAMVADRRSDHDAALEKARRAAVVALPAAAWRDLSERSALLGIRAELLDSGARVHVVVDLPGTAAES